MLNAFSIVMFFLSLCIPRASKPEVTPGLPVPMDREELEILFDGLMPAHMHAFHVPGGVISIVQNGRLVFAKGYGYADVAMRKPVEAEGTLFRLASISKLFVWTAVMQLAEQRKLDLNADVNVYLEDFKIPATFTEPITLLDLMSHAAGFEERALGTSARYPQDIQPLGKFLATHMPARVFPPGEITAYSNYGTALAGYIVSLVSGMPFAEYVQEHIFDPLQMQHSTFQQPLPGKLAPNLANGYTYANGAYEIQDQEWAQLAPAASLSATAADMANFMIAHLQKGSFADTRILQESTALEMQQRSFSNDPRVNGYAHGFSEATINGQKIIGHTGDILHYHSGLFMLPGHNTGIFVAFNGANGMVPVLNIINAFMDHYYPDQEPAPAMAKTAGESARLYEGTYLPTRTEYTTAGKMVRLFLSINVRPIGAQQLVVTMGFPAQMTWHYIKVSPGVFSSMDVPPSVAGNLVFGARDQRRDHYLFLQNNPGMAYTRAPRYAEPGFNLSLLSIVLLLFLSVIVWTPIGLWMNRRFQQSIPPQARLASWWQIFLSLLVLLFLIGFVRVFSNPQIVFGVSPVARSVFLLPLPIAVLAAGMVVFTIQAWARRWWSLPGRMHYTLVTLAGLAFTWWLAYWNLWIGYLK